MAQRSHQRRSQKPDRKGGLPWYQALADARASSSAPSAKTSASSAFRFERPLVLFPLCLAFTLALVYHYIVPLNALPFYSGIKGEDCGQMVWNLWFANEAVSSGHSPYLTNLVYYPVGANLTRHSLAPGYFPVTFLIKKLSGGDPMYPLYAYRIVVLLAFALNLFLSYLLLRESGFWPSVSAIAALAYSFSDFYREHVIHINLLAGFFFPLAGLLLVRLVKKPSGSRAVLFAIASGVAVYFTELALYLYLALIFSLVLGLILPRPRRAILEKVRALGPQPAAAVAVFALILAPYVLSLSHSSIIKPRPWESSFYSANLAALFIPSDAQTKLYGHLFAPLHTRITAGMGEAGVFIGFPLLLFGLAGVIMERRKLLTVSALSLLFFLLSLGPTLKVFSADTRLPLPYALLMRIPPFDWSRTPVRFVIMGSFFLMILAAAGLSWAQRVAIERLGKRCGKAVVFVIFLWVVAEAYAPVSRQKAFTVPPGIDRITSGPVVNLPVRRNDGYAALLQIFHHQPIATGYLARVSEQQERHIRELETLIARGGADFCRGITRMGFRNVIITPANIAPEVQSTVPLELGRCPLNVIDLRRGETFLAGGNGANNFEDEPPAEFPRLNANERIDFRSEAADKYLWYGWSEREPSFHWTNGARAAIVFSLGSPGHSLETLARPGENPGTETLRIKLSPFLVPGHLDAQRLNIELNHTPIAALELRTSEPQVYSIELKSSALPDQNVLELRLPDAESPQAFGLSDDARLLGINVEWIELTAGRGPA